MPKSDRDLLWTRKILQIAIEEQLRLSQDARDTNHPQIEHNATGEAGRLVNRFAQVQEELDKRGID